MTKDKIPEAEIKKYLTENHLQTIIRELEDKEEI
jgi:hypothetical protein